MFRKSNRYVTRGVNEKVDIRLQLIMLSMIDKLKNKGNLEVGYLQVFNLRKEGNSIVIKHYQEVPEYKNIYSLNLEDVELLTDTKIFVIDSQDYCVMTLPEER